MLERVWRKGNPSALLVECKLIQPLWRTVWRFPIKVKIELPYDPPIPLLGLYRQNHNSKIVMYHNVHCSSIYSTQEMEAT